MIFIYLFFSCVIFWEDRKINTTNIPPTSTCWHISFEIIKIFGVHGPPVAALGVCERFWSHTHCRRRTLTGALSGSRWRRHTLVTPPALVPARPLHGGFSPFPGWWPSRQCFFKVTVAFWAASSKQRSRLLSSFECWIFCFFRMLLSKKLWLKGSFNFSRHPQ